jgi:hypothetical protein
MKRAELIFAGILTNKAPRARRFAAIGSPRMGKAPQRRIHALGRDQGT